MAASFVLKQWCFVIALLSLSYCCCQAAQGNAVSIVAKAMLCFNNMTIYKNCQSQYRLTANGTLNVPRNATNFFCNGPCMSETQLVLGCLDGILANFKFYNGATVQAVNSTVLIACGNTNKRGNFNVSQSIVAVQRDPVSGLQSSRVRVLDAGNPTLWGILFLTLIIAL